MYTNLIGETKCYDELRGKYECFVFADERDFWFMKPKSRFDFEASVPELTLSQIRKHNYETEYWEILKRAM